jgi:Glycosyltransferase
MRIGIDGHMIGDHSGGNESYYTNILKEMPVSKDDDVYLFLKKNVDATLYAHKYKIIWFNSKNSFARNFFELPHLCRKYQLDLLHTQYFIPFNRPCKVVCTIHDICFEHYKDIFTKKEYWRQKLLIPYAAKHSSYIFTVSENAKQDIQHTYGIPSEKIIVTYNAVNKKFRKMESDELNESDLRDKYQIGSAEYILSVGNLQPRKNLPRLIEAFIQFKNKSGSDTKLVIVGKKAWLYDDIISKALGTSKDVILTGYVEDEDLVRLYNAAKCFVYPSFFEGFGIPPLEAMACGTPVAVSKSTSLPEVVGDAGQYFDPFSTDEIEKSIEMMLNKRFDEDLYDKMCKQVNKFSWIKTAEIIYNTYRNVK